jgi:hypothetical protein
MRRILLIIACALAAAAAAGCAGYRLGPTDGHAAGSRSVQVALFQNPTSEPRLSEAVAVALRRTLQQDGTFKLNTHGDADVVVTGSIVKFERLGVSFNPNDILTVRDFQVRLFARVVARERVGGRVLIDRDFFGRTTVRAGTDLASAERQALPLLAEDLARKVTGALVDGPW